MNINQYPKFDPLKKRESAFGEIRNSELTPIVHIDFPYNINSRIIKDDSGGGGSIIHASGMAVVSTAASTQSSGILRSRLAAHYTPGQGLHVHAAAIFTSGVFESQQLLGIGDNLCGFFFGYSGVQFGIIHRCNAVDDFISQSEWNRNIYPTLDPTLGNMYSMRLQMGFGQATFGIEDGVTGDVIDVHRLEFSNAHLTPSTLNPHLPFTASALNTGNDTPVAISVHSFGAFTEGREVETGLLAASGTAGTAGVTLLPIISFRNKEVYQGRENQVHIDLLRAFGNNQSNQAVEFIFFVNAILTDALFVDYDIDTSVMEIDESATVLSNGVPIMNGYVPPISSDTFDIIDLGFKLTPGDVVTIAARKISGGADLVNTGLIWKEIF